MVTLVVPGRVVICNTVGVAFSYFIILGVKSKSKTKIVIMEEIKGEMSLEDQPGTSSGNVVLSVSGVTSFSR